MTLWYAMDVVPPAATSILPAIVIPYMGIIVSGVQKFLKVIKIQLTVSTLNFRTLILPVCPICLTIPSS